MYFPVGKSPFLVYPMQKETQPSSLGEELGTGLLTSHLTLPVKQASVDAQGLGATLLVLGNQYPSVQRSQPAALCQAGMEDRQFQLSQQAALMASKGIPSTRGSCLTGFASVVSDGFHLVR